MKYPHFSKLLLSVLLALSCSLAIAKMTVGDLKPIFGESFDAKVKAVQFLSREGSPEALEILQAMSTETLFLSPQGVVIQKNDQYFKNLAYVTTKSKNRFLID